MTDTAKPRRPRSTKSGSPTPSASIYEILDNKLVTSTVNGVGQEIPLELALQQQVLAKAFEGKRKDVRAVLGWIRKREEARSRTVEKHASLPLKIEHSDPANVDEALLL